MLLWYLRLLISLMISSAGSVATQTRDRRVASFAASEYPAIYWSVHLRFNILHGIAVDGARRRTEVRERKPRRKLFRHSRSIP